MRLGSLYIVEDRSEPPGHSINDRGKCREIEVRIGKWGTSGSAAKTPWQLPELWNGRRRQVWPIPDMALVA